MFLPYLRNKDKCLYKTMYIYKKRYQKVIQNAGRERVLKKARLKGISFSNEQYESEPLFIAHRHSLII